MRLPQVCVVIIGRNEGARLVRCLESVRAAGAAHSLDYELDIIYVDSASGDDSVLRAARLGAQVIRLEAARPSAALARNAGWQAASSEFILFLDGDTILHPDFIGTALAALAAPEVAVVWGQRRELAPLQSVYVRVLDLDWLHAAGDTAFCGGDALMRRASLDQVGGFDASLIAGEEPELCSRIRAQGGIIRHLDVPMTLHDLAIDSWQAYWRRAFRTGHAYAEVTQRLKVRGDRMWQRDARRNLVHGAVVAAAPAVLLAVSIWQPLAGALLALFAVAMLLRSAVRCSWKSTDRVTRMLYALHSHVQQLPIMCGQLAYHRDLRRGRQRALIEYKEGQPK
jgi:glycosyltransferase involved in cell wall biosynthesis